MRTRTYYRPYSGSTPRMDAIETIVRRNPGLRVSEVLVRMWGGRCGGTRYASLWRAVARGRVRVVGAREVADSRGRVRVVSGRPVSRKAMLENVWNLSEETETRAIDNFIVRLRRYIEKEPAKPRHLITVRGLGYRFVPTPD